jgi:hypothetical protein
MRIVEEIGDRILALVIALDVRVRQHRVGGLRNEDGDLAGMQVIAITAVGIAIIVSIAPPLRNGVATVVQNLLSNLSGGGGGTGSMGSVDV